MGHLLRTALAAGLILSAGVAVTTAADKDADKDKKNKKEWNVEAPLGPTTTVEFTTDEGTWMNLDVSPDGKEIVFDMMGDIYIMPIAGGSATLLRGMGRDMLVCREETFGPVIAVASFEDEAEVIAAANDTEYGLAAYLFTGDTDRGERVACQLKFGHIGLNTGSGPAAHAPFGGMKQSGIGREGGVEGLMEFCETQVIAAG